MTSTKALFITISLIAVLLPCTTAQVAHVLSKDSIGVTEIAYLPSPAYAAGQYGGSDPLPTFWSAPPLVSFSAGGLAIDQVNQRVYSSDGYTIIEESMMRFPPILPPIGPTIVPTISSSTPGSTTGGIPPLVPIPWIPGGVDPGGNVSIITPMPGHTPAPVTLLTGMSMDPTNNRLFMCNATSFRAFTPHAPFTPLGHSITPPSGHAAFSGIAYDPSDETLWLCDIQGNVYHVTNSGTPIAGEYPIGNVPLTLKGICVDRSTTAPSVPTPLPLGRPRIWVTDGAQVVDVLTLVSISLAPSTDAFGMAFSADGQFTSGGLAATSTGVIPQIRQSRPTATGLGLGCDIHLDGAPTFTPHYIFLGPNPLPGIPILGGLLRVYTIYIPLGMTDGYGSSTLLIPDMLVGESISLQYLILGSFSTLSLSHCLTVMSARP